MNNQGVIFKRCGCQDTASGRPLGKSCPRLAQGRHGSWYFHVSVTNLMGRRERVRRGGYQRRAATRQARDEVLGRSREGQTSHAWTLARWLRYWLSARGGIRPTTRLSHTQYIDRFLIPHLGTIRLAELTGRQLTVFFGAVAQETNRFGQPHTHIHQPPQRPAAPRVPHPPFGGHPNDQRPWQPRGNHMTTTVHTGLDEQLSPQLKVARPKRFELPTF
jgi:hypothetical protein